MGRVRADREAAADLSSHAALALDAIAIPQSRSAMPGFAPTQTPNARLGERLATARTLS
jgi:hypothetical protein